MTESTSRRAVEARLVEKASRDEPFRQRLIANPHAAIEAELNVRVPAGVTIEVLEETPRTLYLVLPVRMSAGEELTEKELESVAGGRLDEARDSSWKKVTGFFGSDDGLADVTESTG
jgi:hypothetical protein